MKFGISFTTKFLNQGNALVNIYTDGTVQVSTGGTEMGQGVNIKIRQIVADEFGIDPDRVRLMPTRTEKNNNTAPPPPARAPTSTAPRPSTPASKSSGGSKSSPPSASPTRAEGLAPSPRHVRFATTRSYDTRRPEVRIAFGPLCAEARRERVDLGARGFYATPGVDFNRETGHGTPFFYYTQGAAVCEVAIDRFTGELTVPRVDLLIDIGRSINPGVDRGQIIGGFIQGMGWVTAEAPRLQRPRRAAVPLADDVQDPRDHRRARRLQRRDCSTTTTTCRTCTAAKPWASRR